MKITSLSPLLKQQRFSLAITEITEITEITRIIKQQVQ